MLLLCLVLLVCVSVAAWLACGLGPALLATPGEVGEAGKVYFQPVAAGRIIATRLSALFSTDGTGTLTSDERIVLQMRLPRALLAACVGALLAVAGSAFQGLLRNPLADPYIIGVSSGAALGASIAFAFGLGSLAGSYGVTPVAFLAAVGTMLLVYALAYRAGRVAVETFLLAGVVVGSFMWASVFIVMTLAALFQEGHRAYFQDIVLWLMGDLSQAKWQTIGATAPLALLGCVTIYAFSRDLNLMLLGEEPAVHLGVRTETVKKVIIAAASLVTAAAVSAVGVIGFLGFIVPHIMRRLVGPDHRILVPTAALAGALFLVLADTLARSILPPNEIPTGVVTALVGAPFFCHLLWKRRREA
ncbi:MAG: FecCD family ABC transporter permease [Armatimonadota bacterium]